MQNYYFNIFELACKNILLLFSTLFFHSKLYKLSRILVFYLLT